MAKKYDMHLSAEYLGLAYEVPQAKRLLNRKAEEGVVVETLQQLAEFLEPYKDAFHSLFRLIMSDLAVLSTDMKVNVQRCKST